MQCARPLTRSSFTFSTFKQIHVKFHIHLDQKSKIGRLHTRITYPAYQPTPHTCLAYPACLPRLPCRPVLPSPSSCLNCAP
jgi:hypothetical protein